ncbi:MAG: DUF4349 domain-containing protein, partial [Actinocrinis sp.]
MLRRERTARGTRRRVVGAIRGGRAKALVALIVAAPIALSACSAGNGGGASSSAAGGVAQGGAAARVPAQAQANFGAADKAAAGAGGGASSTLGKVQLPSRSLIITAGLQVKTDDAAAAAQRAEVIVSGAGGYVADESVGSGSQVVEPGAKAQSQDVPPDGGVVNNGGDVPSPVQLPAVSGASESTQATLRLRVPPDRVDSVLSQLAGKGQVTYQAKSATDVTGQVADVGSRVDSARASIAELRTLIDKAASVNDLISLEQALSQRESDLESLEAQQKALSDQVQYATITVGYFSQGAAAASPPVRTGFSRGLHVGWDGFLHVVRGLLAAIGWLVPYAALVLVLWWPVRRLIRWNRARRGTSGVKLATAGAPLPA